MFPSSLDRIAEVPVAKQVQGLCDTRCSMTFRNEKQTERMAQWHLIGPTTRVNSGEGIEVTVGDRVLAVFNSGESFVALDGICPHAGGPLAEGTLNGSIVTCPWHGWQFDVSTGQHCLSPQICQQTFPVKIEADQIYVELP